MTQPPARRLGLLCLALLAGLLIAGWWPFNFLPANQVSWLPQQNGAHFDQYGEIYSPGLWPAGKAGGGKEISIELWVRGKVNYDTFSPLVFAGDPLRTGNFVIAQSLSDLVVEAPFRDRNNQVQRTRLWINGAFHDSQPRFLTLTSGMRGTTEYLDGAVAGEYPNLTLATDALSGRLLLGHAPDGQEEWRGDLLGLAFYPRALSGGEVAAHVQAWRESKTAELANDAAALYAFDERAGGTVHDRAKNGDDLVIPRRFRVLHNTPLEVPAHPTMSDVQDAAVNILGFIPFGFLVAAYWQQAANYSRSRAVALTVVLGLATSLLIELLQVYVPSRDSSLLDVINNTIGSAVGALFPASILRWRAFSKLRLG